MPRGCALGRSRLRGGGRAAAAAADSPVEARVGGAEASPGKGRGGGRTAAAVPAAEAAARAMARATAGRGIGPAPRRRRRRRRDHAAPVGLRWPMRSPPRRQAAAHSTKWCALGGCDGGIAARWERALPTHRLRGEALGCGGGGGGPPTLCGRGDVSGDGGGGEQQHATFARRPVEGDDAARPLASPSAIADRSHGVDRGAAVERGFAVGAVVWIGGCCDGLRIGLCQGCWLQSGCKVAVSRFCLGFKNFHITHPNFRA